MKLVIVESPSKAKTIEKYLGKEYKVVASKGHIADLPKSQLGVDVDKNFQPVYEVTKKAALADLKKKYKDADELILAVDPDREGEAIGWHVARELKALKDKKPLTRIAFTEITKSAVQEALKKPREIDYDLVDAQQARRILDRLVGYKLSPVLWKKIRYGLSAGRVQSVALRIIVDREKERDAFISEEYWGFYGNVDTKKQGTKLILELSDKEEKTTKDDYLFQLSKISGKKAELKNQDQINQVYSEVNNSKFIVESVETKTSKQNPKPPFTTSTLQQVASSRLNLSPSQTMRIAQKLYEAGHITYMRTDSISLGKGAIDSIRKYVKNKLGDNYLPEKTVQYKSKSKNSQEAHEAIRPTDFTKTGKDLKLDDKNYSLYELIRRRAIASQMVPAEFYNDKVVLKDDKYEFSANNRRMKFDGYLAITNDKVKVSDQELNFKEGEEYYFQENLATQHFTQPPARYTEASLIKVLEAEGIGRPSTYAPIMQTIIARKYVEKEGRALKPTDTGLVVNRLLTEHFQNVVDPVFTAKMEQELDNIAEGKLKLEEMLKNFYEPFIQNIEKQDAELKKKDFVVLGDAPEDIKCPVCGKSMQIKLGRYGRFYSCSDFPDCDGIMSTDGETREDIENKVNTDEFKEQYEDAPKTEDGRDYLLRKGRYGEFWAHPDYPKVKDARPLQLRREKLIELYGEPPQAEDGREFNLRSGRYGEFWAHPDYPTVKKVHKISKK